MLFNQGFKDLAAAREAAAVRSEFYQGTQLIFRSVDTHLLYVLDEKSHSRFPFPDGLFDLVEKVPFVEWWRSHDA